MGGIGSLRSPFPLLLNLQAEKLMYEVVFNHTICEINPLPFRKGRAGKGM